MLQRLFEMLLLSMMFPGRMLWQNCAEFAYFKIYIQVESLLALSMLTCSKVHLKFKSYSCNRSSFPSMVFCQSVSLTQGRCINAKCSKFWSKTSLILWVTPSVLILCLPFFDTKFIVFFAFHHIFGLYKLETVKILP